MTMQHMNHTITCSPSEVDVVLVELDDPSSLVKGNLTRRARKPFIQAARKAQARVEAIWFDTPVAVCQARNLGRARQVPPHVIEAMAAKSTVPSEQEGFDSVQSFAMPTANISGVVSKLTTAIPGSSKS